MYKKALTCILLFLLGWTSVHAAVEPYEQQLRGRLKKGDTLIVKDEKFRNAAYDWNNIRNKAVTNVITFGLNRDSMTVQQKPFSCDLDLKVEYWSQPDQETPITLEHVKLKIDYDTITGAIYQEQSVYNFNNAYRVKITVNEISSKELGGDMPPIFTLTGQVIVDRDYTDVSAPMVPFVREEMMAPQQKGNSSDASLLASVPASEVTVNWTKGTAYEYDVEWTFIDELSEQGKILNNSGSNPSPAVLAPMFRNNATRITSSGHTHNISLVNTSEYLLIRMRSVTYTTEGYRIEQPWSYQVNADGSTVPGMIKLVSKRHLPNMNWQYTATYAEEGKKKEVVSYFDGTLRSRQSVTLSQTEGDLPEDRYAVVQENVYDEFGRKAASILPAPTSEKELTFYPSFNLNAGGTPYSATNVYKGASPSCFTIPDPLKNTSGASYYYSGSNALKTGSKLFNKYIPDAENYPMAVTAYTPDNTGRVSLQGGVGPVFQPAAGSTTGNKATRYFYGKPEQWELDRLFGNDVGYAHHYLKNMVIDPNGQISVSYVNASGKTIATALAGAAPDNVTALPSQTPANIETVSLLEPESFVFDSIALKMTGSTTYLASVPDPTAKLTYNIDQLIKKYVENNVTICSNCYYEMKIRVYDDCNEKVYENVNLIKIGSDVSNCSLTGNNSGSIDVPMNKIGTYYISFELALNQDVIRAYSEDFIARNTNLKTLFRFILDQLNQTDFKGCYKDCVTCEANLGAKTNFVAQLTAKLQSSGVNMTVNGTAVNAWANGLYDTLSAACQASRANCLPSPCERLESILRKDVSPGGQYALFDTNGQPLETDINILSNYWRQVFPIADPTSSTYKDNQFELEDGRITSPNDNAFTLQMLVAYWKEAWAAKFQGYHPEICALTFCQNNQTYLQWDEKVKQLYPTAASISGIKPGLQYQAGNASWLLAADPYFTPGTTLYNRFKADLDNYSRQVLKLTDVQFNNKGLTQYVDYTLYCTDPNGNTNTTTIVSNMDRWNKCVPSTSCRIADREWAIYRDLYFELKEKYYAEARGVACAGVCPVGLIPSVTGNPSVPPTGGVTVPSCSNYSKDDFTVTTIAGPIDDDVYICYNPSTPKPFPPGFALLLNCRMEWANDHDYLSNQGLYPLTFCNNSNGSGMGIFLKGDGRLTADPVINVNCEASCVTDKMTNEDFKITSVGTSGQPLLHRVTYMGGVSKPIRAGVTITVHIHLRELNGKISSLFFTFTNSGPSYFEFNAKTNSPVVGPAAWVNVIKCATPPGSNCSSNFANKISRLSQINYAESLPTDTVPLLADNRSRMDSILEVNCRNMAEALITQMKPCLANYQTQVAALKQQIFEVLRSGADQDNPHGTSTTKGGALTSGGYNSIQAAIKGVLNLTSFTMTCNPWVLDLPQQSNVKGQAVENLLSATNAEICTKLNALKQEHTTNGGSLTFYQYVKQKYGAGMNISDADLTVLLKGCTNCKYLLDREVKLPVFLDPNKAGCINATTFKNEEIAFNNLMGTLNVNDPMYKTVYANYMNQRWGFSLGYSAYKNFKDKTAQNPATTELLCNEPVFKTIKVDPYECLLTMAGIAIDAGKREYDAYIDSVKRDFRKQYVLECSKTNTRVRAVVKQQLYHYTLYYYDNAGNLLRTVPPAGVTPLNGSQLEQVKEVRKQKVISCSYDGPTSNTAQGPALQHLNNTLSLSNQSAEMWIYNNGTGAAQIITTTAQYLFNLCIDGRYLQGDIYTINQETGAVNLTMSNHVAVDMGGLVPLRPWTHIVLQGNKLSTDGISAYVNGVLCPPVTDPPRGSCTWQIDIVNGSPVITENLTFLKHMRLYQRQMTGAEILANAQESCLGINATYATTLKDNLRYWARFNTPPPGGPTTVGGGTTEQQYAIIYPQHKMATDYAYNAQNQPIKQYTPDADSSKFWYDRVGRLFASQNGKQRAGTTLYSYTKYDELSRIVEVGQSNTTVVPAEDGSNADAFASSGTKSQQTKTFYDVAGPGGYLQTNLRNRVSYTLAYDPLNINTTQGTYYNYDLSGNVKTLYQVLSGLGVKQIDYNYDLVSGKVNTVRYQPGGSNDKFYYGYEYDAENRLKKAKSGITASSADQWTITNPVTDATYEYYRHGPLARMELGSELSKVQGVDYAYTLQGWLKGINGNYLQSAQDIGKDGEAATSHSTIAKDAIAFSLDYFTGDYKPIDPTNAKAFSLVWQADGSGITGKDLFNGNISRTTLALSNIPGGKQVGYSYRYDQLNRLKDMRQHPLNEGDLTWKSLPEAPLMPYKETATYDGNGNIITYIRNGLASRMDSMLYVYKPGTNQLLQIQDKVLAGDYSVDLDNQGANNYTYDQIGNLTKDVTAGIDPIEWTVYGKISSIKKGNWLIKYLYDAAGNRVYKEETSGAVVNKTWYVRDAQGNTLAVYESKSGDNNIYWKEQHLYGSSRLGMWLPNIPVSSNTAGTKWAQAGNKRYELNNHLGNVLATISDKRTAGDPLANVVNASDYTPFGMQMVGRQFTEVNGGSYRYGFNGKENDNEIKGDGNQQDYGMRIYDPRVGRFLSVDPIISKYPELTPYQFASNRPIDGIDQDGLEYIKVFPNFPNSGDRTFTDYVNAANNGAIDIINIVPATWNGGVDFFKGMYKGSLGADINKEVYGIVTGLNDMANAVKEDPVRTLTSPDALRVASSFYFAGKLTLPGGGTKGNLLKPASTSDELTTLYRGVNESHVDFENASKGIVKPNGGKASALEHNTVSTLNSPFTSWTTNRAVAENYALRPKGTGVILQVTVPLKKAILSPNLKDVLLKGSSEVVSESEVLLKGKVRTTNIEKVSN